jgi:uncharacterized protein (DUF58 family)
MITRRLIIWILLTIAVYWAIAEFGFDVLIFIFAVQLILPLISLIMLLVAKKNIYISVMPVQSTIERNQEAVMEIKLDNRSRVMLPFISLSGSWHNPDDSKTVSRKILSVGSKSECSALFRKKAENCGIQIFKFIRIAVRDQFGFFYLTARSQSWYKNNIFEFNILPLWQSADYIWNNSPNWNLNALINSQNVSPEIDILANLRNYRPGDSPKRIHWKISARLNNLMTREFEDPFSRYVIFSFDPQKPDAGNSCDNINMMLETAATVMKMVLDKKHQVKWLDAENDWQFREASRTDQFDLLRQSISQFKWNSNSWPEFLSIKIEKINVELLVLIAWHLSSDLKAWIREYLNDNGQLLMLWLRTEAMDSDSEESKEWDELVESGMQGYIVNRVLP